MELINMFIIIFFSDEVLPKMHDHVVFKGNTYDCNDFHTANRAGTYCSCIFLACTGSQECAPMGGMARCSIKKNDYDYLDMTGEDCGCRYH